MDHSTNKGQFEAQHASGTDVGLTGANDAEMHHRRSSSTDFQADQALEALGYKPELSRSRSTLQVAFMSFVLASIPYGLATTLYYPLIGGGPVNIIWGWLGVSMIIVCVAASLGEITSVYPTAGAVPPHLTNWCEALQRVLSGFHACSPSWRRLASWICGWLYVVGNITITLAVNFGTTLFFVACINVFEKEPGVGVFEASTYQVFLIFLAITLFCNAVSALGNKWLPILDTVAIFWTFAGVLAIMICVLVIAKNGRHSAAYVFGHFEANSGWPDGWSFCVGLLHAGYATSSTGMIISMCEEVHQPATQVPKAMVLINLANGQPVPTILKDAVGSAQGAIGLLIPIMVLALICGIGCTTAASRCTWAFARDGAIPGSRWWKTVHPGLDLPLNAMMLSMVVQILLGLIYFGSSAAFNAFSGVGVICLTAAYATPIAISLANGRKHLVDAKFSLGKFGVPANIIALAWSILAMPLFCMPSYIPVTAATVNYAPVVFVGATLISAAWYVVWGHKNYDGPPTNDSTF
ncbi:unnamed protein product [Parascedosporium putredinis]|uniref:Amino acid permease n=1 Tax=Parascedosporium putredinis TaxID=1442378 RepID=A0A9P1H2V1_9PEZI|nr:unnamed protein product [Parascedosporium putredinis]CAI7995236.1 unnamed protein product [Parascedosporium putredinis]